MKKIFLTKISTGGPSWGSIMSTEIVRRREISPLFPQMRQSSIGGKREIAATMIIPLCSIFGTVWWFGCVKTSLGAVMEILPGFLTRGNIGKQGSRGGACLFAREKWWNGRLQVTNKLCHETNITHEKRRPQRKTEQTNTNQIPRQLFFNKKLLPWVHGIV